MSRIGEKTPVSQLQEYMAKNLRALPNYELVHSGCGATRVWFKFQLSFANFTVSGEGPSKQEAKHNTAKAMLIKLGELRHDEPRSSTTVFNQENLQDLTEKVQATTISQPTFFNAVGALNEHCIGFNLPAPEYSVIKEEGPPHIKEFTLKCTVDNLSEISCAHSKQDAKHQCAAKILDRLKNCKNQVPQECKSDPKNAMPPDPPNIRIVEEVKSTLVRPPPSYNAVGALNELCARSHLPTAEYFFVKEEGPPHLKEFTLKCTVGNVSEISCAHSKQQAKRQCAAKMLTKLNNLAQGDGFLFGEKPAPKLSQEEIKVIIEKFKFARVLLSRHKHSNDNTNIIFKDYHNVAKIEPKVNSAVMNDLLDIVRQKDFERFEAQLEFRYDDLFEKLLKEMNLNHDFIAIPPHKMSGGAVIMLNIDYAIPVSFLGIGTGISLAKKMAIMDAVKWLVQLQV